MAQISTAAGSTPRMNRERARCRFDDLPVPQQAGILSNDSAFGQFAAAKTIKPGATMNPSACAEYIRMICGVTSRRELATNTEAATRFAALHTDFLEWAGRIPARR